MKVRELVEAIDQPIDEVELFDRERWAVISRMSIETLVSEYGNREVGKFIIGEDMDDLTILSVSFVSSVPGRVRQNVEECWNGKEFDWEEYQHLCDIADYWDCEE